MVGRHTRRSAKEFLKNTKIPGVELCHPRYKSRKTRSCLSKDVSRKIKDGPRSDCADGDEICLVEKSNLSEEEKKKIIAQSFRPKTPSEWNGNMSTWLSDEDIRQVMSQYEEAYPEFKFLEVAPIDFSAQDPYVKDKKKCIAESFCKIDFSVLKGQGKKYLGAVFNLDPSYKSGSHWVAIFIDIPKKQINYFDSYGMEPPRQIAHFMKSLTLQERSLKLQRSGRRFQYKGSECGMYSMIFILSMLNGENFRHFCKNPISDSEAQNFREFLYR